MKIFDSVDWEFWRMISAMFGLFVLTIAFLIASIVTVCWATGLCWRAFKLGAGF